jgi:hypothetical protein
MDRFAYNSTWCIGIIWWIGILFPPNIESRSIFFPSELEPTFRAKLETCVGNPLAPFEFQSSDFTDQRIRDTFSKINQRSKLEGSARAKSIRCLQKLDLTKDQIQDLGHALEAEFNLEVEIFFIYVRWLDSISALDKSRNESFLKSRYDLMKIIQIKTKDLTVNKREESSKQLDEEFSSLYLSVLRSYYDYFYEMEPASRELFFYSKKGNKR